MASLTTSHERALTLLFSEIESSAAESSEVFLGTPGTLAERENDNGTVYWVRRFTDALNRRQETYLGKVDDPEVAKRVSALQERIALANATATRARLLSRAGFATVDRKAYYTLASLHNHGLFRAGALLIGSHAYGALLNALGVRAVPYATEDVDIARREALALPDVPSFQDMLRETGIDFYGVPSLDRLAAATSFAEPGGARLRVDLLVPSTNDDYPTVAVPELKTHAKGLPYLAYLLGTSQEVPVLSSHGAVMVRVPTPERFAIHKLIVSQLRTKTSSKPEKDLRQAATLIEAVVERFPGAIENALQAVPKSASKHIERAAEGLAAHLPEAATAAWQALKLVRPSKDIPRGMERYLNRSGNSRIVAYKVGPASITVQFSDGSLYLYTYESAGAENIERMKELAVSGRGLSSFIAATASNRYEQKFG
ncbi:MAG: hypothetical protein JSR66_22250 [Proteobacteria bacterium]|nr:hypothetical protein [Pseudomonadota bacterium]